LENFSETAQQYTSGYTDANNLHKRLTQRFN